MAWWHATMIRSGTSGDRRADPAAAAAASASLAARPTGCARRIGSVYALIPPPLKPVRELSHPVPTQTGTLTSVLNPTPSWRSSCAGDSRSVKTLMTSRKRHPSVTATAPEAISQLAHSLTAIERHRISAMYPHLHVLIHAGCHEFRVAVPEPLPAVDPVRAQSSDHRQGLNMRGMYGGSGQRHRITPEGSELLASGWVDRSSYAGLSASSHHLGWRRATFP